MNFNLFMPVRVISGEGCVASQKSLLKTLGSRCLIITGRHAAAASGALGDITAALDAQGIAYSQYDSVVENPTLDSAYEAGMIATREKADFLIGIGGGSVLDATKAAALFAANPGLDPMDIFSPEVWRNKAIPWVACGTTAGTGSEVTAVSVLTLFKPHMKKSITHPALYATMAFADPRYTHSCSQALTLSAAVDAIAHAVEAYFSEVAGDVTDRFALQGLSMLCPALHDVSLAPQANATQREQLYYGSLWAGLALNGCGTCFPHPLGYVLTEDYNVPHGFACGVFTGDFLKRAVEFMPKKAEKLQKALGFGIDEITKLVDSVVKIPEIKMNAAKINAISKRFEAARNMTISPGGLSSPQIAEILIKHFT